MVFLVFAVIILVFTVFLVCLKDSNELVEQFLSGLVEEDDLLGLLRYDEHALMHTIEKLYIRSIRRRDLCLQLIDIEDHNRQNQEIYSQAHVQPHNCKNPHKSDLVKKDDSRCEEEVEVEREALEDK